MEPTERVLGFYRAKVVDNRDEEKFGRVKVWIPALMHSVDESKGLWARAANNPVGGRNTRVGEGSYYYGACYIPRVGSYVLVFFEGGNINRPYYFASLEIETSKVLPENQLGSNFQDKWTIFKSPNGRCIVVSDDPDDLRVEITGKKRKLSGPPAGDTASVYEIDGNQTTILLDERSGKEKVLIRTHKGDYIHVDVDEQKLQIKFKSDIDIETQGNLNIKVGGNFNRKVGKNESVVVVGKTNMLSGKEVATKSVKKFSLKGQIVAIDGSPQVNINCGQSVDPVTTEPEVPQGERDT